MPDEYKMGSTARISLALTELQLGNKIPDLNQVTALNITAAQERKHVLPIEPLQQSVETIDKILNELMDRDDAEMRSMARDALKNNADVQHQIGALQEKETSLTTQIRNIRDQFNNAGQGSIATAQLNADIKSYLKNVADYQNTYQRIEETIQNITRTIELKAGAQKSLRPPSDDTFMPK